LMILALLVSLAVIVVSGCLMLTNAFFGVSWIETLHGWMAHALLLLIPLHILGVAIASRLHRENLAGAMFTGWKDAGSNTEVKLDPREPFRSEILTRIRGNEGLILLSVFAITGLASGWVLTSGRTSQPVGKLQANAPGVTSTMASSEVADPGVAVQMHALKHQIELLMGTVGAQDRELKRQYELIRTAQATTAAATGNIIPATGGTRASPDQAALPETCNPADFDRSGTAILQFGRNMINLESGHYGSLDRLITVASACPQAQIKITGYADQAGRPDVNRRVSQQRAEAAATYLAHRGLPRPRLQIAALGSEKSVARSKSQKRRASDRRVEIALVMP
jgi:outer membrane protein OmpA-like peptidoglycan-associated protein